ncbi:MAG: hypothetical protein ABL940_04000 [Bacteroidia bacterium]
MKQSLILATFLLLSAGCRKTPQYPSAKFKGTYVGTETVTSKDANGITYSFTNAKTFNIDTYGEDKVIYNTLTGFVKGNEFYISNYRDLPFRQVEGTGNLVRDILIYNEIVTSYRNGSTTSMTKTIVAVLQ